MQVHVDAAVCRSQPVRKPALAWAGNELLPPQPASAAKVATTEAARNTLTGGASQPEPTRSTGPIESLPMPESADALADIVLPDQDGNDVRLGDLWRDGPVALVWLRHYG
jgi:hypothetical protein